MTAQVLAVIAAVLALAGAPADTVVVCNPVLSGGVTYYTLSPPRIEMETQGCAALLLAAATDAERAAIARLNPSVNIDRLIGAGLLLAVHEAAHAGLRSGDETLVQCRALKQLPVLLARYAPNWSRSMDYARAYDASLPPEYHAQPC